MHNFCPPLKFQAEIQAIISHTIYTSKQPFCCPTSGSLYFFLDFDSWCDIFRVQNSLYNPENFDHEVLDCRVVKLRGQSSTLIFQKLFLKIMVHIPEYEPHSFYAYFSMVI